ncbi:MAG: C-type lectin domain-containing protein [Myxococcota bacterium]
MRRQWKTVAAVGVLVAGCKDPTQLSLEFTTEAACPDRASSDDGEAFAGLGIVLTGLGDPLVAADSAMCRASSSGRSELGSLTLTPGDSGDFRVTAAMSVDPAQSGPDCAVACSVGCIVAHRRGRFIDGIPLRLPIHFGLKCLGRCCDEGETCSDGVCTAETDFEACENPPCDDEPPGAVGRCGDFERNGDEACDDGNDRDGDGCSADCRVECGPTANTPEANQALGYYLEPSDGHCYFFPPDPPGPGELGVDWEAADAACASLDGGGFGLAALSSRDELGRLLDLISPLPTFLDLGAPRAVWLGGIRVGDLSPNAARLEFAWLNGEPLPDDLWAELEPNDSAGTLTEDRVALRRQPFPPNEPDDETAVYGLNDEPASFGGEKHLLCERIPAGTPLNP